jgi:hypothetical protein
MFSISIFHSGSPREVETSLAPLLTYARGKASNVHLARIPYLQVQSAGDAVFRADAATPGRGSSCAN